jgi:hypothetical protein
MNDISKLNEAIRTIRNECSKHEYCMNEPMCPFYKEEIRLDNCCMLCAELPDRWEELEDE